MCVQHSQLVNTVYLHVYTVSVYLILCREQNNIRSCDFVCLIKKQDSFEIKNLWKMQTLVLDVIN